MRFKLKIDLGEGSYADFTRVLATLNKVQLDLTYVEEYPPTADIFHTIYDPNTGRKLGKWSICRGD